MKIWEFRHPDWGRVFTRISDAIHRYSYDVEWVNDIEQCDVAFVHIVGWGEKLQIENALQLGKKVVNFQHCYFTSGYDDWDSWWEKSNLTMSFHNLPSYTNKNFNFYGTPLGAEESTFQRLSHVSKDIKVFATGHVAETEYLREVYDACNFLGKDMYHTGHNFRWGRNYKFLDYLPDNHFSHYLNKTQYIPCLRGIEGFEVMGIEGLFCGARPIVLDLPTYHWYKGHAYFIDPTESITEQLVEILKLDPEEPSLGEREVIIEKFSWKNIVTRMFDQIHKSM